MKKSELVIGNEYYVCPSQDWQTSSWDVKRVRITNTEHGKWRRDKIGGGYVKTTLSTGRTGIVVEELHKQTGAVIGTTVVSLASIRGEWETTSKNIEERRAENRKARLKVKQATEVLQLETGRAVAIAKQMGVPGIKSDVYGRKIEVHPAVMQAMLLKLESIGWQCTEVSA